MGEAIEVVVVPGVPGANEEQFRVTVGEGNEATSHEVTVPRSYALRLTGGSIPTEELVRESFEFLLEREPKESILGQFELSVISRYFPEFEQAIQGQLR